MFGRRKGDEAIDRLEVVASRLETDLRKVVVELSAAAAKQVAAANRLQAMAEERVIDNDNVDTEREA